MKRIDLTLLSSVVFLTLFGLFMVYDASSFVAFRDFFDKYHYVKGQAVWVIIGLLSLSFFSYFDYKKLYNLSLPILLTAIVLLIMVFIPGIGVYALGARRWINLGFFVLQPAEFVKLALAIYLASWLSSKKSEISSFQFGFLPFLVMVGAVALILALQPDIGTLGIITISSGLLFFLGGGRLSQIGIIILLGLSLIFLLTFLKPYFYLSDRIFVFLNPSIDPQGRGYQLNQSLIAVGSGKIFGQGFGMSSQKFNFLPEPTTDSIFSVFTEEFGFAGSLILISLFFLFFFRGFFIAGRAPDSFGALLVSGFVILIAVEVFANISAMLGLIPLTGVPLVFISQGGTALIMTLAEVGVILNVSRYI